MTVRDIQRHLEDLYGVDVSPDLILRVTSAVAEDVVAWQTRPLDAVAIDLRPHAPPGYVLQWAVMPRLRLGAFTFGAGMSGGEFGTFQLSYTLWANFEAGGEHWLHNGLALPYVVGYARGCTATSCTVAAGGGLAFPYLGLGVGYAF